MLPRCFHELGCLSLAHNPVLSNRAFKIQPSRPDDLICVDGELFDGPYLEAQVHRGMACVMATPGFAAKK